MASLTLVNALKNKKSPLPAVINEEYQNDPSNLMAYNAMQAGSSMAPVSSPLGGLARMLQGVVGAYQAKNIQDEYQGKADSYRSNLAKALSGSGGDNNKFLANLESSNDPYLMDLALNTRVSNMDANKLLDNLYKSAKIQEITGGGSLYGAPNGAQTQEVNAPAAPQAPASPYAKYIPANAPDKFGNPLYNKEFAKSKAEADVKTITDSERTIQDSSTALSNLQRAKDLNPKALSGNYAFMGPETRSGIAKALPGVLSEYQDEANATDELKQALDSVSLAKLKDFVGGNQISDRDVKTVQSLAGAMDSNVEARGKVIDENIAASKRIRKLAEVKSYLLKQGMDLTPDIARQIYAEEGVDFETGLPIGSNPSPTPASVTQTPAAPTGNKIRVQTPDGRIGKIDESALPALLAAGGKRL